VLAIVLLISATRAVRRPLQEPLEKETRQKETRPRSGPLVVTVGAQNEVSTGAETPADSGAWSTPAPRQSTWWEASWANALRFRNPVLHREVQRKLRIRKPPPKIRALLKALSVIALLLYCWGFFYALGESYRDREVFFYLPAFLFLIIVSVAASSMSATAFPRERESHTWESLRLSLLTPHQIVMGKLLPPLIACWVATFVVFLFLSPIIATWRVPASGSDWSQRGLAFSQFAASFLVFCSTIWCYSCWGLLVSWWSRRSWIAVTVTISSLIFVLVFIPIFIFLSASGGSDQWVTDFLATWHPFFALIEIADQSWRQSENRLTGLVVLYLFITIVAGYMWLGLLYREIMESMRENVPWSLKMNEDG
jgi:ABC-type transport system involved in multi-copper enzyme maturation permease subunit